MSREQARQSIFHDDRYRLACEYGFPVEWYRKIREDFPEIEVAYDITSNRMLAFALRSSGFAQVVDECASSDDACRMHQRLCESRSAADSTGLKEFIAADRARREKERKDRVDDIVNALDPSELASDFCKLTDQKGARVAVP